MPPLDVQTIRKPTFFRVELPVGGDGFVYLDEQTLGVSPLSATAIIITSDQAFTVEVETPRRDTPTWAPYPLAASNAGDANEIVVVRGRWPSLKITTAGTTWVAVDTVVGAWDGA